MVSYKASCSNEMLSVSQLVSRASCLARSAAFFREKVSVSHYAVEQSPEEQRTVCIPKMVQSAIRRARTSNLVRTSKRGSSRNRRCRLVGSGVVLTWPFSLLLVTQRGQPEAGEMASRPKSWGEPTTAAIEGLAPRAREVVGLPRHQKKRRVFLSQSLLHCQRRCTDAMHYCWQYWRVWSLAAWDSSVVEFFTR